MSVKDAHNSCAKMYIEIFTRSLSSRSLREARALLEEFRCWQEKEEFGLNLAREKQIKGDCGQRIKIVPHPWSMESMTVMKVN